MNFLFFLCGILAVGCVVLISAYMILSGMPAIRQIGLFRFLFGTEWASTAADPQFGILPFQMCIRDRVPPLSNLNQSGPRYNPRSVCPAGC